MFQLQDKISLGAGSGRLTAEGYLDISARISRSGVYEYNAFELGDLFSDRESMSIVRVLRHPDDVFDPASMASFARQPVTDGHPWENVNASNIKEHQVGACGETLTRDGIFVAGNLRITHADAINKVQRGDGELSAGYRADITRETGEYEGERYDARMRKIIGNHIALVDAGRCGPLCRVGDRAPSRTVEKASVEDCGCSKGNTMNTTVTPALQARVHDGHQFQISDVGAVMFDKVVKQLADSEAARQTAEGKAAAAELTHAAAITAKDAEIKALKDAAPDAAKVDALVADRVKLLDSARKLLPAEFVFDGKSAAEIHKAAVMAKHPTLSLADKVPEYVAALFDGLVLSVGDAGVSGDPLRSHLQHATPALPVVDGKTLNRDQARKAAEAERASAWKN